MKKKRSILTFITVEILTFFGRILDIFLCGWEKIKKRRKEDPVLKQNTCISVIVIINKLVTLGSFFVPHYFYLPVQ